MKKLLILLMLLSGEAMAQSAPKTGYRNYKGTDWYGYCIDGVEYLDNGAFHSKVTFPRLKPDGKPVTCNY